MFHCIYMKIEYFHFFLFFFFNDPATTEIYTLSLHDSLPISGPDDLLIVVKAEGESAASDALTQVDALLTRRSEEHTSELQSQSNLVCRLLLEKKKKIQNKSITHLLK